MFFAFIWLVVWLIAGCPDVHANDWAVWLMVALALRLNVRSGS